MSEGRSRRDAVREAQQLGFAEADPTLDLDGTDSLHKIVLAAAAAYGEWLNPDDLPCDGIDRLSPEAVASAARPGQVIRLVASIRCTPDGIACEVGPVVLPAAHPLADTRGAENRVLITPTLGPPLTLQGLGAGRWPTAEAVLADIGDVHRARRSDRARRRGVAA